MTETVTQSLTYPPEFVLYVDGKLGKSEDGGRPHFIKTLSKTTPDVQGELLNIVEEAWIKNRPLGNIAHARKTKYHSIYRLLQELEPMKTTLTTYLLTTPRRKRWYIPELDQSDYETVQEYINHARREELKKYREVIRDGARIWKALNYKDPANWAIDEVLDFLTGYQDKAGMQYGFVVSVRALCPQLRKTLKVRKYLDKIRRVKVDIFSNEVNMIHACLRARGLAWEQLVFDLHVTVGAREGKRDDRSGIVGMTWTSFKDGFKFVDDYESKVRKGITWRECPVDLFFADLPDRMKALWTERGKPSDGVIIPKGYPELTDIYARIRTALDEYYREKAEPSLLKEFSSLRPHCADKIHVNLLWEAEVPLETVAGEYLGQGEGVGLMGRGWLNTDVIKNYYLSLTRRSARFQKVRSQVRDYSARFTINNGGLVA